MDKSEINEAEKFAGDSADTESNLVKTTTGKESANAAQHDASLTENRVEETKDTNTCYLSNDTACADAGEVPTQTIQVIAVKVFFQDQHCVFRFKCDNTLKQVLAEAADFWNVSASLYTLVDENDWVISLQEKLSTFLNNASSQVQSSDCHDNQTNTTTKRIGITVWMVCKEGKRRRVVNRTSSDDNSFQLPSISVSLLSNTKLESSVNEKVISPLFRFPISGQENWVSETRSMKTSDELMESQSFDKTGVTDFNVDIPSIKPGIPHLNPLYSNSSRLQLTKQSQSTEVANMLVSPYPQRDPEQTFSPNSRISPASLDHKPGRSSLIRAAVVEQIPSSTHVCLKQLDAESVFERETEQTFCHLCGQPSEHSRDVTWLIRCKANDCGLFYHPDCVGWIPFEVMPKDVTQNLLQFVANTLLQWKCPKHKCLECGKEDVLLASCIKCTTSYCPKHVPPTVRPQPIMPSEWQKSSEGNHMRKILCDLCVAKGSKRQEKNRTLEDKNLANDSICVMNVETIVLPSVQGRALEYPWFATHVLPKYLSTSCYSKYSTDSVHEGSMECLEGSSGSTRRESIEKYEFSHSYQKRPYIRRVSPESLRRNNSEFLLKDGTTVKLGASLNIKLTNDDVAAGLANNRVLQAAFIILKDEGKPLDAKLLSEEASQRGFQCLSLMPNNTFSSQIYRNMKRKKADSAFYKVNNGEFGLKMWLDSNERTDEEKDSQTNQQEGKNSMSSQQVKENM